MRQDTDERALDGNAAAGTLGAIFPIEMTTVQTTCAHCGNEGIVGTLVAYITAIGTVLRCPTCDGVMLRVVQAKGQYWLDMQGMRAMCIPAPPSA